MCGGSGRTMKVSLQDVSARWRLQVSVGWLMADRIVVNYEALLSAPCPPLFPFQNWSRGAK